MRFLTTLVLGICVSCMVLAQDEAKKPAATKEIAKSVWDKLNAGPSTVFESNKIILMMPKTAEPKAKDITSNLEKYYENAAKSVGYKEDNAPWTGKLMVFIMPEREQFVAFVRRVEKRSPSGDDHGAFGFIEGVPYMVSGPTKPKDFTSSEVQAYKEMGGALLRSKAGEKTPLPDWVVDGFGRAVHWRVQGANNKTVQNDRRKVQIIARKVASVGEIWSGSDAEATPLLQASVMEFIAFGPQSSKLPDFLKGFIPEENGDAKSAEQALDSSGLVSKNILGAWKIWVLTSK